MSHKKIIIFICSAIAYLTASGQNILEDLEFSKGSGVIFPENYLLNFNINGEDGRYTPSISEVRTAENLIAFFDCQNKKVLSKGHRQYIGYYSKGEKMILVHVMKFRSRKKFEDDFPHWKKEFGIILSDPDDSFSSLYMVNLTRKMIGFY